MLALIRKRLLMPITQRIQIDPVNPDLAAIERAADVLRAGGLVAFPTETVYGLGAAALQQIAVERIFAAKGRPPTNPLIIHVGDATQAESLAAQWPPAAAQLADRFWPGPLSIVVRKRAIVPDVATAGGPTVALRVPAHAVARRLIEAAGTPVAAPSANLSSRISATCAEHVLAGLAGRIDLILDAGPTSGGLESTVVDVTVHPPRVLRPGLISARRIEEELGRFASGMALFPGSHPLGSENDSSPPRSPGLMERHYAPAVGLECVAGDGAAHVEALSTVGLKIGWLTFGSPRQENPLVIWLRMPRNPVEYAARLYAALHTLESQGADRIVVDLPPLGDEWLAIHDRLRRASAP